MHGLFWLLGLIPEATAGRAQELAQFKINYVFYLNIAALAVTTVLILLNWRAKGRAEDQRAST